MIHLMTPDEWAAEFGRHLRDLRLRRNLDRRTVTERSGVALNAVKNLEAGSGATVASLAKVLRALGKADWLDALAPVVSISPMQLLKSRSKRPRQRASGARKADRA